MRYVKHILIFFLTLIFLGCASFSKKEFRKQSKSLTEKSLIKLNGNYSFYPIKRLGKRFENKSADSLKYTNSYQEIVNENWNKKQNFDSILNKESLYSINLKFTEPEKLRISLLENGTKIRDTVFNGKLKNGMFYIDNKFLKCKGVPYLFGGCQNNKRRIGLTENNNLIINEAVSNEGAILLILGAGISYNSSFEFKRIK